MENKQEKQKREFKGVWIPAKIWLAEDLSIQEKVFLAEIESLDGKEGCFATNSYFSNFFKLSKTRCSQIITNLREKKYIDIIYKYKENSKEIEKRTIKVNKLKYFTPFNKLKGGVSEIKGPPLEKFKENNPILTLLEEEEEEDFKFAKEIEEFGKYVGLKLKGEVQHNIYKKWREDLGFSKELVKKAGELAVIYCKNLNLQYIDNILHNWYKSEIRTLEQVEQEILKHSKKTTKEPQKEYTGNFCQTTGQNFEIFERS